MSDSLETKTYRVKQGAEMMNVPLSTVYEWVRTRRIGSVRVGKGRKKLTLITSRDIDDFINAHYQPASKEQRPQ